MNSMHKNLLLINPWIYDFAAYDLWSKPLGLLYLASFLRQQGFLIDYIDCMDKYVGDRRPKVKKYGIGNFRREIVQKPDILSDIPRHYARYGMSKDMFYKKLREIPVPDAVLVSTMMTYWYLGPKHVIEIIRELYPKVPVIVGGVYATLMPEHVKSVLNPDIIVTGPGEKKILKVLCDLFQLNCNDFRLPIDIDDYPYPAFDLVSHPDYLIIMTARGCPFNCSFCAQKQIAMDFTQRNPKRVVQEISDQYRQFKIHDFAFYDDALFINRDKHIKVILRKIIESPLPVRLHSPNGLFARYIDSELAQLMFRANFKTIRLSFETSNEDRRKDMYNKISNYGMVRAIDNLVKAGYEPRDLEAYVLMGLPEQDLDEVVSSIIFVNNLGVQVRLASYSPIPGTKDFDRAVKAGIISPNIDPLLTNNSIFPLNRSRYDYESFRKLRILSQILNEAAKKQFTPFADEQIGPSLKLLLKETR